ncbi:endonuclease/exonuclease/phosphatase family protein [Cytobacillus sp. IB215316]|uniref:endonuclease/exonuclease/phosphatase family protein n=1 Tax=Cytobacillus sp. IB215316 TaxID=3097354 RepID=UPI002A172D33|nr:endonuclease/exonuclease/phosphatase family protein [Cytobacillus sp. IB215316]MDX8360353.1 endonuclease/exonuclease/phosphatase family protein [Cytobacillus sp. IB215316]
MLTMSFNILADRRTWRNRRDGIINKILDINPDIVGLQEAMSTQRRDLEAGLSGMYDLIRFNIPVNYGNPILIRSNRFTILDSGFVEAAQCGNTRYITWFLLREVDSGEEFYFYNNHYCVSPTSSKEDHAIELVSLINQHQVGNNNRHAIVVGDFNATRNNAIMEYLLDQIPIDGTPNPMNIVDTWDIANQGDPKPSTTERGAAIDWVLTLSGTSVTAATVDNSDGFSDHFPVTATFTL